MSEDHPTTNSAQEARSWIWGLTLAVAALPVGFGLYLVWVFFDEPFPHLYWSRTFPALAGIALCLAGIAAPVWVLSKRRAFRTWPKSRQWSAFVVVLLLMAFAYATPFVRLADAARKSRAILSYTPGVFLIYSRDEDELFRWGVSGGQGTGWGSGERSEERIVVEWNAWLEPKDLPRPPGPDPVVHLRCEAAPHADPLVVDVEITTGRTVIFYTRGFTDPSAKIDGKLEAPPIELQAGTHRLTIEDEPGHPD